MKKVPSKTAGAHERVMFSLPKELLAELGRYAQVVRGGNKSGFVADAVQAYITHLRKTGHTHKLRQSYAAAAGESLAVAEEWEPLSEEAWAKLDMGETSDYFCNNLKCPPHSRPRHASVSTFGV